MKKRFRTPALPDYRSVYASEREEEIRTLTDPQIRQTIVDEGICLVSNGDFLASGEA